jgi:hypothetical protein
MYDTATANKPAQAKQNKKSKIAPFRLYSKHVNTNIINNTMPSTI